MKLKTISLVLATALGAATYGCSITPSATDQVGVSPIDSLAIPEENPWWNSAKSKLEERKTLTENNRRDKNVIVFIGDGMGVSTITASRIFDGQSRGESGEENQLSFDRFPHLALVKTYNTNQQVSDSAGTATAIHSGVKTRAGVLGIDGIAHRGDCAESLAHRVPVIAEVTGSLGLATGIVTTTRVTHATPASLYAHSPERDWESDQDIPDVQSAAGCKDIAYQLVEFEKGNGLDVVFGGGTKNFLPQEEGGSRSSSNLLSVWSDKGGKLVTSKAEMSALQPNTQGNVLGLFAPSHLTYMADKKADNEEPTLSQMTAKAIDLLSVNDKGYYLMVEGGRIDHAHHDGSAGKALMETQEFAKAVQVALDKVDLSDTLILVTADHSHVFTLAGYPTRGNDILDVVRGNDARGEPTGEPMLALDKKPYTTLGYGNGPGAIHGERGEPETGLHGNQQATVPTGYHSGENPKLSETHGGEDVALFAIGPKSHLVGGVIEQHVIYHIIAEAFGWQLD